MQIFFCSHCGQRIDSPEELTVTSVSCPSCSASINVPVNQHDENPDLKLKKDLPPNIQTLPEKLRLFRPQIEHAFWWLFLSCIISYAVRPFGSLVGLITVFFVIAGVAIIPALILALVSYFKKKIFVNTLLYVYPNSILVFSALFAVFSILSRVGEKI